MEERIYCPECEGTEIEKNYDAVVQNRSGSVEALQALKRISIFRFCGRVIIRKRREHEETQDEAYSPESYRCKSCRTCFFSSQTYSDEIHWAKKHRKMGLVYGFMYLFFAALSLFLLIVSYLEIVYNELTIFAVVMLIYSTIVCLVGFRCAVFSSMVIKRMNKQWKQYTDVRAKYTKTAYSGSEAKIPTWKRIQIEGAQADF